MPSKGVKCYAYIAVQGVEIEFSVPKQNVTKRERHEFSVSHLEVESKNLGVFKFTGRFEFKVRRDGRELNVSNISAEWSSKSIKCERCTHAFRNNG